MRKDAPGAPLGFTLVELSAALAVLAILLGLALPAFQDLLRRQRADAAMHLIGTQLAQARIAAIASGVPVTVCPSSGDGRCRTTSDWSQGWLAYRDPARASQPRTSEDVLSDVRQPLHASVQVLGTAGRLRLRYQPDGLGGGSNVTLRVCADETLWGEVIVNNLGRSRTRRGDGRTSCEGS